MILKILQGETVTFTLSGEELSKFGIRAVLYSDNSTSFARDCKCSNPLLVWNEIKANSDIALWHLTSEQSAALPVGKYAVEVELKDLFNGQVLKREVAEVIEVRKTHIE